MHTRSFLVLGGLALGLAACQTDPADAPITDTTATDMAPMDAPMAAGDTSAATVEGTVAAFENGITNVTPAAALPIIDGWLARLENAEFDQARELRQGLTELRGELTATPIDADGIGETLRDLGEQTTASAQGADAANQANLRRLGTLLTQAGSMLGGEDLPPTPAN